MDPETTKRAQGDLNFMSLNVSIMLNFRNIKLM